MSPKVSSSSRALAAVIPLIESSQAYEAHQKARTFASRYVKAGQYDTAIDVLFQSARELLKVGQTGSGVDLAAFLVDVYTSKGEEVDEESRSRLTQLIALTGPSGTWRKTLIDKAISWSVKYGACPAGDQDLQHYIGELLYKEGSFDAAEPHFLAAGKRDSARLLAQMMAEWSTAGGSPGAFALRGTVPYLQNGNILAARTFITQLTSALPRFHPTLQPAPVSAGEAQMALTADPVVNFSQLAVLTCQRAHGEHNKVVREAWVRLCGTYQSRGGLLVIPEVRVALNEIAALYFAISLPQKQPSNPFGQMLSSLFGDPTDSPPPKRMLLPTEMNAGGPDLD